MVDNDVNVVCFTADLGQPDKRDVSEIRERMLACEVGVKKNRTDERTEWQAGDFIDEHETRGDLVS